MRLSPLLITLSLFTACGDDTSTVDAGTDSATPDAGDDVVTADVGPDAGPLPDVGLDSGVAMLSVHIVASGDEFPHADLLAGQTARATEAGVRSLSLHRSMTDANPVVLFSADGDVPVGYVPGDDTVLATVPVDTLEAGNFVYARLVQTYARYEVDATLHRIDGSHEGVVSALNVIGDATTVDGMVYDAGHYDLAFTAADITEEWTGEDGVFPDISATAGAIGVVEDGVWAVYFPIELEIAEVPTTSGTMTITVNMFESFRWTDLLLLGYLPGVFDVTDISFEPVLRFGGNSFELSTSF